jgi:Fe-Mn family superoxide dismutase
MVIAMFQLPPLPYDYTALQPTVGETTMRTHHDKHHKAYVDMTNTLLADNPNKGETLEEVVRRAEGKLFNNAAQAWNHAFFWESMTPSYAAPAGELAKAIDAAFGGLAALKEKFVAEGAGHFASGWVWLVAQNGELKVISTHDAATAVTQDGVTPILLCDVWEHAYYLDYKNVRKEFLEKWFDGVANWAFAAKQYDAALGKGEAYRYPKPDGQDA